MSEERLGFDGSPSGAHEVEIEWILPDAGRFGRDRRVSRQEATHARITEHGGARAGSRVVSRLDGESYAHELALFARERELADRERERERAAWEASLASRCERCDGRPRDYEGLQQLQVGGRAAAALLGDVVGTGNVDLHLYTCGSCGSAELQGACPERARGVWRLQTVALPRPRSRQYFGQY